MATTPIAGIAQLQSRLAQLAPKLAPQPMPKFQPTHAKGTAGKTAHVARGLDLLLLMCATQSQKEEVLELVQKFNKKPDTDEVAVLGAFDAATNAFNLTKAIYLNETQLLVHNFVELVELQIEDPEAASEAMQTLLTENGHEASDLATAEECLSVAYALHTLLRAFPSIPFSIQGTLVNIDETTEILPLLLPLFAEVPKGVPKAAHKKAAKADKKRKQRAVERAAEDERVRRVQERADAEDQAAIVREINIEYAVTVMEAERQRRISQDALVQVHEQLRRESSIKEVTEAVETERSRRVSADQLAEVSSSVANILIAGAMCTPN
ncbi:hypothetical protein ACHHYP_09604 [Achlya hypogyna]|uniref:Uncharacterized protein n=1 Tax=Achlya hypogyna TaxID=1202772 RepID=A0A1V9YMW8_ACHHY|nr:hypothetical protein ACHHYP_09604 [Achlya hypogyna]